MNIFERNNANPELKDEIARVLEEIQDLKPGTKEYTMAVQSLRTLYEAQSKKPAVQN